MKQLPVVAPWIAILIAWSVTTLLFIAIPVIIGLRRDVRLAKTNVIARRRFFFPSKPKPLHAALLDKIVWIERYTYPAHDTRAMRITAVRTGSLQFEDGTTFEPRSMSKGFADGRGAAKGVMHGDPALVIFV